MTSYVYNDFTEGENVIRYDSGWKPSEQEMKFNINDGIGTMINSAFGFCNINKHHPIDHAYFTSYLNTYNLTNL